MKYSGPWIAIFQPSLPQKLNWLWLRESIHPHTQLLTAVLMRSEYWINSPALSTCSGCVDSGHVSQISTPNEAFWVINFQLGAFLWLCGFPLDLLPIFDLFVDRCKCHKFLDAISHVMNHQWTLRLLHWAGGFMIFGRSFCARRNFRSKFN